MINATYAGNIEKSVHSILSGTGATTIGAAAANNTRILAGWSFANTSGSAVTCQLIHRQGGTDYIVWVKSVPTNDTGIESNVPVRILEGDSIKVVGNTGVIVTLTYTAAYPLG